MFLRNDNFMSYEVDGFVIPRNNAVAITDEQKKSLEDNFMIKELLRIGTMSFVESMPESFRTTEDKLTDALKEIESLKSNSELETLKKEALSEIEKRDREIEELKRQLAAKGE